MSFHLLTRQAQHNLAPMFTHLDRRIKPEQIVRLDEAHKIRLRPILPKDEPQMVAFHARLSEENIYCRYFEHMGLSTRTLHERLGKVCQNTIDSFALIAETTSALIAPPEILAVGRLALSDTPGMADFALLIRDDFQESRLPRILLERLLKLARGYGFHTLSTELLLADYNMLELCRCLKFTHKSEPQDGLVRVTHTL